MILRGYCGAKGFKDSDPFHIKLKAHAEEEELPLEDPKGDFEPNGSAIGVW